MNKVLKFGIIAMSAWFICLTCVGCGAKPQNVTGGGSIPESAINRTGTNAPLDGGDTHCPPLPSREDEEDEPLAPVCDYEEIYSPILDRCIELAMWGSGTVAEDGYTMIDNMVTYWDGGAPVVNLVGYSFIDVSGDGLPELIISDVNYNEQPLESGTSIYALYTIVENKPVLVFEGWERNIFHLMGQNHFYNNGSSGASSFEMGDFSLSSDGCQMIWNQFLFSDPWMGDYDDVRVYINNNGECDPSLSTEIDWNDSRLSTYDDARFETIDSKPLIDYLQNYLAKGYTARLMYTVVGMDQIHKYDGFFTIDVGFGDGQYELIVDENTVFDPSAEMQYFGSLYQTGDSPYVWFIKNYESFQRGDPDRNLMGVFDVSFTGNHIDRYYGSYWWD